MEAELLIAAKNLIFRHGKDKALEVIEKRIESAKTKIEAATKLKECLSDVSTQFNTYKLGKYQKAILSIMIDQDVDIVQRVTAEGKAESHLIDENGNHFEPLTIGLIEAFTTRNLTYRVLVSELGGKKIYRHKIKPDAINTIQIELALEEVC